MSFEILIVLFILFAGYKIFSLRANTVRKNKVDGNMAHFENHAKTKKAASNEEKP